MKIVALVHMFPYHEHHRAGSEVMLKNILVALHKEILAEVTVIVTKQTHGMPEYTTDGIKVIDPGAKYRTVDEAIRQIKPDMILSHHDETRVAGVLARKYGARFGVIIHNNFSHTYSLLESLSPEVVICNTEWIAEQVKAIFPKTETITVHPPLNRDEYCSDDRVGKKYVTLVNLNQHKGARLFYDLARSLPEIEFLGVKGGHGDQVSPPKDLSNLTILGPQETMAHVYSKTAILLIPSIYESFGMVIGEAQCSGVHVIGSTTSGITEALNGTGQQFARNDFGGFQRAIKEYFALTDSDKRMLSEQAVDNSRRIADFWLTEKDRLFRVFR